MRGLFQNKVFEGGAVRRRKINPYKIQDDIATQMAIFPLRAICSSHSIARQLQAYGELLKNFVQSFFHKKEKILFLVTLREVINRESVRMINEFKKEVFWIYVTISQRGSVR
ncbi:MAG: hypothetical protein K0R76_580 [Alphaproteobacteria bacterium]|nr:hypothetical protein [Alphaproteobacteria bacterium]